MGIQTTEKIYPALYVLMRTDLPDYVPGKAMAQANHAGTQFLHEAFQTHGTELPNDIKDWLDMGNGFGTCIVLGATYPEIRSCLTSALSFGIMHGMVFDPTYPIKDGDRTALTSIETCGWVFGYPEELRGLLGSYKLF